MPSVITSPHSRDNFSLPRNTAHDPSQHDREGEDEYRHRVRVNLFATLAVVALITIGVWIANMMVETQKAQGCYASGMRICSLI